MSPRARKRPNEALMRAIEELEVSAAPYGYTLTHDGIVVKLYKKGIPFYTIKLRPYMRGTEKRYVYDVGQEYVKTSNLAIQKVRERMIR